LLDNAVKFVAPGVRPQVRIWAEAGRGPKSEVRSPKSEGGGTEPSARGNTLHASPSTPDVSAFVRLWFADNGIGIPEEAQDRIFGMFQRLDKSYDGTGVGLTVVRKAVEKMGGRVGLESEPGCGSRFWVELGAAIRPDVSATPPPNV